MLVFIYTNESFVKKYNHCINSTFSTINSNSLIIFLKIFLFILRETEREQGRGRERGRERITSKLHAVSADPDAGLKLTKL